MRGSVLYSVRNTKTNVRNTKTMIEKREIRL